MVYNESQALKDTWFIPVFFGIQLLVTTLAMFKGLIGPQDSSNHMSLVIVLSVSMLIGLLLVCRQLMIRLDAIGFFINSLRKYKGKEVKKIQPIKKTSIWAGRGLGFHYDLKGEWKYLFSTAHVVRVSLKDSSFIWSTHNPDKIMEAWEEWRSER